MPKSMDITLKMVGMPEVKAICDELPNRVKKKGLRRAINLGATPIVKAMKRRTNGLLKKSITKRVKGYANGNAVAVIGPDRSLRVAKPASKSGKALKYPFSRPAFVSHLVDKGHGGPHPAPAHAFRDPAYQETKELSASIVKEKMVETLEAEALKLGRR
jgi:hypothetical protein